MLNFFYRRKNNENRRSAGVRASASLSAIALLVVSLFSLASVAGAKESGEIIMITAEGAAQKSVETPNIKSAAIEQALKNAVAEVLESVLERERVDVDPTIVETEIYSNAVDFIKNFKVLSEESTVETVLPTLVESSGDDPANTKATKEPQPTEVVTYHIWVEAAIDTTSLRGALGEILFADEEFAESISLVLLDLTDYRKYRTLLTSLERITMIREIRYDSFTANRYAFTLEPTGSMSELMRRIAEEVGSDYIVTGTKSGTIIVKASPATISFKEFMESPDAD
ncbi:MAG: hypothetical protein IME99_03170 [Proteobacteria bacterium]|nr:hypothetical protein [Pseudomonadota bacterium]